jgi:hypothetical protein
VFAKPEITVPTALLERNAEAARQSPKLMHVAFERAVRRLRTQIVAELATPLGAHKRPTRWQSAKQRRWWFGVGRKTWSGRTGNLSKGWKTQLTLTPQGGLFTVFNKVPYKRFVQGNQAQRMHFGTWRQEDAVIAKFQEQAAIVVHETWVTVSSPTAGVPR